MVVCKSISSLDNALLDARKNTLSVGFVPTMGALHDGHGALIQQALSENNQVVVSIFVNPTQFNNPDDLKKYPRPFQQDLEFLSKINPKIIVFNPSPEELYRGRVTAKSYNFGGIELAMEGQHRPGHFDGVGTVLDLLFRAVQATRAYFGEKDFQQLQIVRKLVEIEKLAVQIIGCPIYREESGLAMSSRNRRLSKEQLEAAPLIYHVLKEAQERFESHSIPALNRWAQQAFADHPILKLEYFEIAAIHNLKTAKRKHEGNTYRAFVAAFAGEVRLIDNMSLN